MNETQLNIDIALSFLKLSKRQFIEIINLSDRKFECVDDINYQFTGFCKIPNGELCLMFESDHSETLYFKIEELTKEDKIYLLELTKQV